MQILFVVTFPPTKAGLHRPQKVLPAKPYFTPIYSMVIYWLDWLNAK